MMMEAYKIRNLVRNGLKFTNHGFGEMLNENLKESDLKEVLLSGLNSHVDFSKRNNKSFAWNKALHNVITYKNITVVFCDSKEHACLIISVYHGLPHDILSNPYTKPRPNQTYNSFGNRKVFR
jgi:hypothetical protein